jgi:trimeric autotransporter adhesin
MPYTQTQQLQITAAVGKESGYQLTQQAVRNVAVGTFALDANTEGNNNTAVGYASLGANTTGARNSAFG